MKTFPAAQEISFTFYLSPLSCYMASGPFRSNSERILFNIDSISLPSIFNAPLRLFLSVSLYLSRLRSIGIYSFTFNLADQRRSARAGASNIYVAIDDDYDHGDHHHWVATSNVTTITTIIISISTCLFTLLLFLL